MRRYMLAAVAATAIASPAAARDNSGYVGLEGGIWMVQDVDLDTHIGITAPQQNFSDGFDVDHKTGFDTDLIGGYDFGMFRLEGELGYKHTSVNKVVVDNVFAGELVSLRGTNLLDSDFDFSHTSILSLMANALVDVGGDEGVSGYIGAGAGLASVKMLGDHDSGFAWQVIAGLRFPVSANIDAGLKYRYFTSANLSYDVDADAGGSTTVGVTANGAKLRSHSLLASLIYNFAAPPPP